ncbi:MAG: amidohydrolase family protein [Actinobacteria bacterium]|nr:amidohydrolase family protein [Actinomycetota bacterium]
MITVFTARRVHTMDLSLPEATAVAVLDGRIIEVGSLDSLQPWLSRHDHVVDDGFADAVILPGLIDPHVHPGLIALLLACEWVTPEAWDLPGRHVPATVGREAFVARLYELEAFHPAGEPLVVYGWHAQFHGELFRDDLDAISTDRPIVLWQRSFHELRCNTPALAWLEAEEGAEWDPHIDLEAGRMWESGMGFGLRILNPHLIGGEHLGQRLEEMIRMVHGGGVTTIGDPGYAMADLDHYLDALLSVHEGANVPFRQYLIPAIFRYRLEFGADHAEKLAQHEALATDRIRFLHAAKFFADGAFIAQLMQVGPPGYIDGHEGAWMANPDRIADHIRPSWEQGRRIDIHVNGDMGLDAALDAIDMLLHEIPRFDHRTVIHHFGLSTQAQSRRMAALGVSVQANGYFLNLFGDAFVDRWLGAERASQITRVGSARRNGISVALHSDLPMGPLLPMKAASNMSTRLTLSGEILGLEERLSPYDAIAAVTIEAAWQLRLDHEIGSLAAGKQADLVVLDGDPFELDPTAWPDIPIRATVLGGEVYPCD